MDTEISTITILSTTGVILMEILTEDGIALETMVGAMALTMGEQLLS